MKFLVPNYSCLQNPWLRSYRPQIPVLSVLCPQLNLLNLPQKKEFLGTPLLKIGAQHILPSSTGSTPQNTILCPKQRFLEEYLIKMCIFSCYYIVDVSASKADRLCWMKSVDDILRTHSELCFENILLNLKTPPCHTMWQWLYWYYRATIYCRSFCWPRLIHFYLVEAIYPL